MFKTAFLQVVALLIISTVHLTYLRLQVPMRLRLDQIAEQVSAAMEIAALLCTLPLLGRDGAQDNTR